MNNNSIKIVVDYTSGNYLVYGLYHDEIHPLVKPIRGIDRDGFFKANYSNRMMNYRKYQIKGAIREIEREDPDFKYSKKSINRVDSVMYKILESWDLMSGTTYAIDYLKTIVQDFKGMKNSKESDKMFEEKCAQERKKQLDKLGIDISYNTALFNTDESLTFIDRIRGIIIAKKQKKYIDAKVNNSLILKDDYYETDIDKFIASLKEKIRTKNRTKTEKKEKPAIILNKKIRESKFESIKKASISSLKSDKFENHKEKPNFSKFDIEEPKPKNKPNFIIEDDEETRLRVGKIIKGIKEDKIIEKEQEQEILLIENNIDLSDNIKNTNTKHWTRKVQNEEESIKNMKYKPSSKKRIITGAISILAAGIMVVGIHNSNFSFKRDHRNFELKVTQATETEMTDSVLIEENNQPIIKIQNEEKTENTALEDNKIIIEKNENTNEQEKNQNNQEKDKESKINKKQEIKKFKKMASKRYNESMSIGESLHIGDIFDEQTFSENPDGTGNKGYFSQQSNYAIGHICVISKDGWKIIDAKGETLESILEKNPEYDTYNIHFINSETGGALGFVTQNQYEELVENKINEIVENKTNKDINKNLEEELDR